MDFSNNFCGFFNIQFTFWKFIKNRKIKTAIVYFILFHNFDRLTKLQAFSKKSAFFASVRHFVCVYLPMCLAVSRLRPNALTDCHGFLQECALFLGWTMCLYGLFRFPNFHFSKFKTATALCFLVFSRRRLTNWTVSLLYKLGYYLF